jgi:hypothetical protein
MDAMQLQLINITVNTTYFVPLHSTPFYLFVIITVGKYSPFLAIAFCQTSLFPRELDFATVAVQFKT